MNDLIKEAENGDANKQFELGFVYKHGKGIPVDFLKAMYWFEKAAEQGHLEAQATLGSMYDDMHIYIKGKKRNSVKAKYWYEKAAEQGDVMSQYYLGELYFQGIGIPKNIVSAKYWYEKAAEQGNEWAQYMLGKIYFRGQDIPVDYEKAQYWFAKASSQENLIAQEILDNFFNAKNPDPSCVPYSNIDEWLYDVDIKIPREDALKSLCKKNGELKSVAKNWIDGLKDYAEEYISSGRETMKIYTIYKGSMNQLRGKGDFLLVRNILIAYDITYTRGNDALRRGKSGEYYKVNCKEILEKFDHGFKK